MTRSRAYAVGNNGWIRSTPVKSRTRTTVQSGNNTAKTISASCTIRVKRYRPLIAPDIEHRQAAAQVRFRLAYSFAIAGIMTAIAGIMTTC